MSIDPLRVSLKVADVSGYASGDTPKRARLLDDKSSESHLSGGRFNEVGGEVYLKLEFEVFATTRMLAFATWSLLSIHSIHRTGLSVG